MSDLIKSRQRVSEHGEVFTPPELVNDMIDLVADEASRIEARFLEPACGSGNFLEPVLVRKLKTVLDRYGQSEFECRNYALLALMSIYGIELLADNVYECKANLLGSLFEIAGYGSDEVFVRAAESVVGANIIHGDALTLRTCGDPSEPITFAEWSYLGKGKFHRRDFRFDSLTQVARLGEGDSLFAEAEGKDLFSPSRDYGRLTLDEI